jgi:uncharacterized membrane protein
MNENRKDDYVVPLKGAKLLSKREANKAGLAIILGLIGATISLLSFGGDNKILVIVICALFAGAGYFWLGDKIFKK